MKYYNLNGGIFILFVLVTSLAGAVIAEDRKWEDVGRVEQGKSNDQIQNPKLDSAAFAQKTKKLQIPFIANNGQVDKQVKYYANTFGGTVFVTKEGEIVYALPNNSSDVETQCLASSMHSPNGIHNAKCKIQDTRNMSNTTNRVSCIMNQTSHIAPIVF